MARPYLARPWFESDEQLQSGLSSPEMGAAVEDAKNFLDMERRA
jgi:hypothetical protein